jgi:hypothetical protein
MRRPGWKLIGRGGWRLGGRNEGNGAWIFGRVMYDDCWIFCFVVLEFGACVFGFLVLGYDYDTS